MPVLLITYAQPVSDDVSTPVPRLTDEYQQRITIMRQELAKNPPAFIALPGVLANDGSEAITNDPQAYFLCNLLKVPLGATEHVISLGIGEEYFHKPTFNSVLNRMSKRLGPDQVGLVICSPDAASLFFRKKVGPCQMMRFRSTIRQGSARLVLDETMRMPRPALPLDDDKTQEVPPEQQEAAMRQVNAIRAAHQSIATGQRVADICPDGIDLRDIYPDLIAGVTNQGDASEKKEATFTAALWVLFGLIMAGMLVILIRISLN